MSLMLTVLLVAQVISSLAIIILVLLQQGKGADMGSAFGSGSAGSLFGATGAANFLSRTTKWAAVVFFATTAGLAYLGNGARHGSSADTGVMQNYQEQDRSVPQIPGAAPAAPSQGNDASVPSAPAQPAPAAPAQPDASVPAAPAPEAGSAAPSAPADQPADKPAEPAGQAPASK